ncbi:hypothetical protein IP86_03125 [Rhodopseudomonas sp. AAP120]|uniref:hypothetical protein n=1 Tax=Rhodopseudomonas sp. AAP120 TaxID=1523430 RepID=UPI0006B911EE|nr:hypothetical protein [Rhodopseudomonas sp. AAP120]KPG01815.1 hypothetical protein IP86_03125 [Rhodopseudomonas sp. AAP120]
MAQPKTPFIQWREQPDRSCRPRFAPSSREIALGFSGCDLQHPDGRWYSFEDVRLWLYGPDGRSGTYGAIVAARKAGKAGGSKADKGKPGKSKEPRAAAPAPRLRRTVADLIEDWQRSPEFAALRPATRRSYVAGCNAILYRPMDRTAAADHRKRQRAAALLGQPAPQREAEAMAGALPAAIGRPELRAFFNYLREARGHHMALATITTLSAALSWGTENIHWRLPANPRPGMEFERPDGRVVLVTMTEFVAWVAAADGIGRLSIGDSFYLALFTGQRQTDRLAMRDESEETGRHAFRQSKTGELVDIKSAPQLVARLDAARARVAELKLKLGLRELPPEIVVNEDGARPYDESTYRYWVSVARDIAVFGWPAGIGRQQAINRAQALAAELRSAEPTLLAGPDLETLDAAARNRAIEDRSRALRAWLDAAAGRDAAAGWRLAPTPSLLFVNRRGALDAKHDQDLRDTCVMLLDRAGCDLLTISDITGHSYKSAQTIVKHYRARNAARADEGIDRLVLQVRKEGMTG